MTDTGLYFAFYYVLGMVLMALFIRFYFRKKRMRDLEKRHAPGLDDDPQE